MATADDGTGPGPDAARYPAVGTGAGEGPARRIAEGAHYVAIGSSFAAGPGIPPVVERRAGRSGRNYPHQVADALGLRLTDVTRSGATTADVLEGRRRVPPQVDAVTEGTALVTITVGGNDLGYIGGLIKAGLAAAIARRLSRRAARWVRDRVSLEVDGDRVEAAERAMTAVGEAVRRRAPAARVLFVDYLTIVGSCEQAAAVPAPLLPLTPAELRQAARTAELLAEAFAAAAGRSGAELVRASAASLGHGPLSPEPWVTGYQGSPLRRKAAVPYHPTQAGMTAVAGLVVEHLRTHP
ncbi:SGNH/GDSL hydrolase family protein [Actinomadura sp. ATCC 31491]|uniref:SGNH/GDSL hydrolase family protein n=1 Tax=Actinomadura luzonensis TaxID=2805427 RepID=A0ABT0G4D4_9ACTN|nr:SGNH/GDSL hydrolase family protein [Actinomadura luzonensis]MCK2219459.1 SGNH/GDSL hydrolase family protein [Actinomadura luzonensis]